MAPARRGHHRHLDHLEHRQYRSRPRPDRWLPIRLLPARPILKIELRRLRDQVDDSGDQPGETAAG